MYGFVYETTNKINGKKYIGQKSYKTKDWKIYLGSGIILNKAIKKYGRENFSRKILEECESKDKLNEREIYWIKYYNAIQSNNFYNIASGGNGGNTIAGYTEEEMKEHSIKLSKVLKGKINQKGNNPCAKAVICLNTMEIFETTAEAAKKYSISDVAIQSCCNKKKSCLTAGVNPKTGERLSWEYYINGNAYKYEKPKRKPNHPNIAKIYCYTTNETFNSVNDAAIKYRISGSGIRECCNFNYSTYGELEDGTRLQWFYLDYYLSETFDISNHPFKSKLKNKKFCIDMYDKKGVFIKNFKSQIDANLYVGARKNGTSKILECCRGKRKSSYGYIWKFA